MTGVTDVLTVTILLLGIAMGVTVLVSLFWDLWR